MLVPNPVTAPVVRLIFELATKGMKYTEIANYLNDNGYDSIFEHYQKLGVRRCYERDIGQHMWSPSTVMGILYNEVYIGSVINNKTADNIDTGHQVVQRDKEDWIIVENCHEPLVSVEDFKLAHKMIARRENRRESPMASGVSHIFAAECVARGLINMEMVLHIGVVKVMYHVFVVKK